MAMCALQEEEEKQENQKLQKVGTSNAEIPRMYFREGHKLLNKYGWGSRWGTFVMGNEVHIKYV